MNSEEIIFQIALTMVPNIGAIQARLLLNAFGSAENIFKAKLPKLSAVEGIGPVRAKEIIDFKDFSLAEAEWVYCEKYQIQILAMGNEEYPKRLLNCNDAPTLLYYKGNASLNTSRIVTIIGTRSNTDYGKKITEKFIESLMPYQVLIVSGLALGIDAIAHRNALQNGIPTVGVLGHGLDSIYPTQHTNLSKEMVLNGGLLTEFRMGSNPEKHHFPRRNRIAAGMSDVTIVMETDKKGGSMITAEYAWEYNKDLFALPGKVTDNKSLGCLQLIADNKAVPFLNTQQFIEIMGWETKQKSKPKKQTELFVPLTANETILIAIIKEHETIQIDELYLKSGINSSSMAEAILNLELNNIIVSMPGKVYKLA